MFSLIQRKDTVLKRIDVRIRKQILLFHCLSLFFCLELYPYGNSSADVMLEKCESCIRTVHFRQPSLFTNMVVVTQTVSDKFNNYLLEYYQ